MRNWFLTAVFLMGAVDLTEVACGQNASPPAADDAALFWNNGDSLKGTLLRADTQSLTWQSPLFRDPLQIDLRFLTAVRFPQEAKPQGAATAAGATQPDPAEFRILLRGGDVLSGKLLDMTDATMTFEGARCGRFQIDPKQVISLQKGANAGLIFSGPRGLEGWQPAFRRNQDPFGNMKPQPAQQPPLAEGVRADQTIANWSSEPDGSLTTLKSEAIFLPLQLPKTFEIELQVRSKAACRFVMAIGQDAKDGLRLETWLDEFVIADGANFTPLRTLSDQDRSLHVHAFVNQEAKKLSVYSSNGQKLGEIATSGVTSGNLGLLFRNGDRDLSLQRLRVSHWDGTEPRIAAGNGARIQLADGTVHFGTVDKFDSQSGKLSVIEKDLPIELPLEKVVSIFLYGEEARSDERANASQLVWNDGGSVSGTLISVADGVAVIATTYSNEPLRCRMSGAMRLRLSGSETPGDTKLPEPLDQLSYPGGSLRGQLVFDDQAETPIRWKAFGGKNASALTNQGDARFLRVAAVQHLSEKADWLAAYPDVIYLNNNDALPCRIQAYSDELVQLTSPFTESRSVANGDIRAVELATASRLHQKGFGTDGDKLVPKSNFRHSYPSILTGDTIRFHLDWSKSPQAYATLVFSLFGKGQPDDPSATHVVFNFAQGQLQIIDRIPPANRFGFMQANTAGMVRPKGMAADVQLVVRNGGVHVSIDGTQVKTIKLNPAGAGSRHLEISGSNSGMQRMVVNGRVQQSAGTLEISNFEVDNLAGASIRQFIEEESRQATLTIPRFRRENPPTHVLVAPNGDLLRGRLIAVTDQQVQFESRLETLRFERRRVAAIIWLHPKKKSDNTNSTKDATEAGLTTNSPQKPAQVGLADNSIYAQLADGFGIAMTPERLADGQLFGQSALLGKCSFPVAAVKELFLGNAIERHSLLAYERWTAQHAKEPDWDIPKSEGGNAASEAMIGKVASDFELPLLDGSTFRLKDHADKIVVLDFWATWCGPCVKALPDYVHVTSSFDRQKVIFVAVNLEESPEQIRGFLAKQKLSPLVALDRSAEVSQDFQVSGIPHTVILSPGNVVEEIHVGYQPDAGETMHATIRQLLDGTWKRRSPSTDKVPPQDAEAKPTT